MATADTTRTPAATHSNGASFTDTARRLVTETKASLKTSEFWMISAVIVGILISAAMIKGGDSAGGTDEFIARQAWLYVAIVAGAYAIGRGLAKSGTGDPYTDDDR